MNRLYQLLRGLLLVMAFVAGKLMFGSSVKGAVAAQPCGHMTCGGPFSCVWGGGMICEAHPEEGFCISHSC